MYSAPPPSNPAPRPVDGDRPSRLSLFWKRHKAGLRRGSVLVIILLTLGGGSWILYNMLSDAQMETIRRQLENIDPLKIRHIIINGNNLTDKNDVIAQLDTHTGQTLFGFSVEEARLRINKLPFVEHSTVERRLPDSIVITLTEHLPIAIWQTHGHFVLINQAGERISEQEISRKDIAIFRKLPLVVGNGANNNADTIIMLLKNYPSITSRTLALVRVGNRRWNIVLRNGATILLPEGAEEAALKRLDNYQQNFRLLERPLASVDMRLADRMVIHLSSASQNSSAGSNNSAVTSHSSPLNRSSSKEKALAPSNAALTEKKP
ncbi:FtsQ-type POTRA domain-containing protein [Aristophania vespae]|uniref:Cell division protein FtsQ n=1 Tax=Aristophania vespae TaxID=2697033 RepID=A0A6P1NGV1_9PROT|nr:FtsQ-type POTRA domain-containing protein [Aristophania vespae]QHI95750.1 FtsQ-type POTRA domain-containing protein [Aristophania vespae]